MAFSALDWWGALAKGMAHPLAAPYRKVLAGGACGPCSVAGLRDGCGLEQAASVNASLSHLEEVDDGHRLAMMHPAVTTFPAVMAIAESADLTAERVRAAVVAGYEAGLRVGTLLGKAHYSVCHMTATAGCFGAAASAASALGLDPQQTLWAFGHAGTQAAGLWQFLDDGAEAAKAFHPAIAVRNGLTAARLAQAGIPGAARVLEGRRAALAAWKLEGDGALLSQDLGRTYQVETATIKGWPTCGQMHSSLDAMRDLMADSKIEIDQIERIVVTGPRAQVEIAGIENPKSFEEAKFSTRLCMAFLVVAGELNFSNFDAGVLRNAEVCDLAKRVEVHEDNTFTARFPAERPARVDVSLRDGAVLSRSRSFRRGDPEDPWSWDDLVARFSSIAGHLKSETRKEIVEWSAALASASGPQAAGIRRIFGLLNDAKETADEA